MSAALRRTLVYWLLLLVPSLAIGLGAILLLRREQGRLLQREAQTQEARRAAIAGRAGLVVENIELLLGDVQTGLLDVLESLPGEDLDRELEQWERTSPMVRLAFRCDLRGRILRPSDSVTDDEARGFRRRFAPLFASSPPWGESEVQKQAALEFDQLREEGMRAKLSKDEREAREQASANVAQLQSARRDAQYVAKVRGSAARQEAMTDYSLAERSAGLGSASESRVAHAPSVAPAAAAAPREQASGFADAVAYDVAAAPLLLPAVRGWTPWQQDGRLHVLGWLRQSNEVRGVELEIAAVIARLAAALPADPLAGEGYAVRDDRGRVMHQTGWIPADGTTDPTAQLPVASNLLPGWEVVGFLQPPAGDSADSGGFFVVGSLLAAILLVTILAGGALLHRQARQSEVEAAQKTSFVANVSHEFKTPLTTIRLYSELLEQGRVTDEAKRADYLRTIGRETQRLARLVGNALDFSRLEQGQKKFAPESIDLTAELERLAATQELRLGELGLALRRELPAVPVVASVDRDALEQIVLNLIDNAVKYASSGGEVTVSLAAGPTGGAQIRVLDRGPGVPTGHRERIFEKFHRVDDALTAEKAGAGLGLSIARQLARGMGGDLRFEPREGGGASFILSLP